MQLPTIGRIKILQAKIFLEPNFQFCTHFYFNKGALANWKYTIGPAFQLSVQVEHATANNWECWASVSTNIFLPKNFQCCTHLILIWTCRKIWTSIFIPLFKDVHICNFFSTFSPIEYDSLITKTDFTSLWRGWKIHFWYASEDLFLHLRNIYCRDNDI